MAATATCPAPWPTSVRHLGAGLLSPRLSGAFLGSWADGTGTPVADLAGWDSAMSQAAWLALAPWGQLPTALAWAGQALRCSELTLAVPHAGTVGQAAMALADPELWAALGTLVALLAVALADSAALSLLVIQLASRAISALRRPIQGARHGATAAAAAERIWDANRSIRFFLISPIVTFTAWSLGAFVVWKGIAPLVLTMCAAAVTGSSVTSLLGAVSAVMLSLQAMMRCRRGSSAAGDGAPPARIAGEAEPRRWGASAARGPGDTHSRLSLLRARLTDEGVPKRE